MGSFSLKQLIAVGRSLGLRTILERTVYPFRQRWYEWRQPGASSPDEPRRHAALPEQALGAVVSHTLKGSVLELACENGRLQLEVMAAGLVRVRLQPATERFDPLFSYALDPGQAWPLVPFEVEEDDGGWTIRTGQLACRLARSPCRLGFYDALGQPLSEPAAGLGFRGKGVFCTRYLAEGEAIYGLAEKALDLNLRGRTLEMWNADPEGYAPGDDPLYVNIPFLIGLRDGRAYGLFFDNPGRCRFDLGQSDPGYLRYEAGTGELCLYFFAGPDPAAVVERYTQLTGRMPLPPRWMLGYHQSRWSYYPEDQVRETAAEFRRRSIPCDAIHLDIHHLDGYRVFTWDRERFPDPARLVADLARDGLRVVTIVDPGVKVDDGYAVYEQGRGLDAFCKLPGGTSFRGPVWPGICSFPDFTDERVRTWWGGLYGPLLDAGVAGFWDDMNEPSVFGGEMAANVVHHYEGRKTAHSYAHNVYGLQMARATAEGLGRLRPGDRIPLISRAGYAGIQRFALIWTGDNGSTWEHLRLSISMCLNLGLSGVAFCGTDVGGFSGDCDGELLARWTQVGALTPYFRNHSALGTIRQEPWVFGEPYESVCRTWIELRYRLLPYLYTAAWQASRTGLPMMRAMALAFPTNRRACGLDDQFLMGDALLAAPVLHLGQRARNVCLPGDAWYDFWTGDRQAGSISAEAPLDRMPLYVRPGTVLPMAPVMQHTGEWPPAVLQLHVYPGTGESWLYDDDGHSHAYRDGDFRLTRFLLETKEDGSLLLVQRQVQGTFDPGYEQFDVTVYGQHSAPLRVAIDGRPVDAAYDPETKRLRLEARAWSRLEVVADNSE